MRNKRDAKLDSLLGKKVYIIWNDDDDFDIGVLGWQGEYNPKTGLKPYCYYLKKANGLHTCFRKSHVKHVMEVPN
jgi:hypothetical protein